MGVDPVLVRASVVSEDSWARSPSCVGCSGWSRVSDVQG
jgi:hypothetical protein